MTRYECIVADAKIKMHVSLDDAEQIYISDIKKADEMIKKAYRDYKDRRRVAWNACEIEIAKLIPEMVLMEKNKPYEVKAVFPTEIEDMKCNGYEIMGKDNGNG